MTLPKTCVLDSCFVIDWVKWRKRDSIKQIFSIALMPETALKELATLEPLRAVREWISSGWLTVYPHFRELEDEALEFMLNARTDPRIPRIDMPEAICAVLAKRLGSAVLTENRGILRAYSLRGDLFGRATVLNSIRLIAFLHKNGFLSGSFCELVEEYESDTKHSFSRREIEVVRKDFGI